MMNLNDLRGWQKPRVRAFANVCVRAWHRTGSWDAPTVQLVSQMLCTDAPWIFDSTEATQCGALRVTEETSPSTTAGHKEKEMQPVLSN